MAAPPVPRRPPRAEDWDARFPLSDNQKVAFDLLQEACLDLPDPSDLALSEDDYEAPLPIDPKYGSVEYPVLGLQGPVETTQQFFNWFETVEQEMERGQEEGYRSYLGTVYVYQDACEEILGKVNSTADLLTGLHDNYDSVEGRTKALQNACEKLLAEQTQLAEMADSLSSRLSYFNEIEPITKFFASPGDDVCLDDRFVPMLLRLDECLTFVQGHMQYRDAELYLMRFRQCMTRGLTLIKMHFVRSMRGTLADIKQKIANRGPKDLLTPNMQLSLFYVKFRTLAPSLRFLLAQLEARCENHPEYYALLGDCLSTYFQVRQSLLDPYIAAHVAGFLETGDVLTMARSGCAYVLRLCADEMNLFHQYFHLGEDELAVYLDSLSAHLYETLRPLILRESRIDALSELCQTLHIYLDSPEVAFVVQGDEASPAKSDPGIETEEVKPRPIETVVENILEDAQQRLVFRSQTYIREEIEGFTPREEELAILARGRGLPQPIALQSAYSVAPVLADPAAPAVLRVEAEQVAYGDDDEEADDGDSNDSNKDAAAPSAFHEPSASAIGKLVFGGGEWYPTMHRTLYILGKLYQCVPNATFEELAQEAVDCCRESLVVASGIISNKQTKLDGQFFLIKNLLMLREHITPYTLSFVRKEEVLDFTRLRDTVSTVLQSRWNIGTLSSFGKGLITAGAPVIVESYADAKQSVDQDLKRVCEEFILETARTCVEPIAAFMLKVSDLRRTADKYQRPLIKQDFGSPEQVTLAYTSFRKTLTDSIGTAATKMADYLGDRKTETVLMRVIKSNVVEAYSAFHDTMSSEYDYSVMKGIPSVKEVAMGVDAVCRARRASMKLPIGEIEQHRSLPVAPSQYAPTVDENASPGPL
ncbi:Golgi transport complex subunit 3 [Geranomyces variabilis]|nr:Golgi transport complex subunit 3 [Geranomyces variabilis]